MPILSTLPALPSPIAASPIAPATAGEGTGDGFAAMLAGLSAAPAPQVSASAPPPQPDAPLPQVRQDPAVWLPTEEPVLQPQLANAPPAVDALPAAPAPVQLRPDCEMPAAEPLMPEAETAPAAPPRAHVPIPRTWVLRVATALTPARLAPKAATPEPQTNSPEEPHKDAVPGAPVITEIAPAPIAPAPAPDAPPAPPQPVAVARAETSAAPPPAASLTVAPVPVPPMTERAAAPTAAPAPARPAPEPLTAGPAFAPDLLKQVAQAIEARPDRGEPRPVLAADVPASPALQPAPAPVTLAPTPASPPAIAPAQPAPIDLGRAEWVQAMVDRIADLPQANFREAQIRLIPDALGVVDVRVTERDDRMQVTLTAETAQARLLLSEAAPRLQELAEARGLRFAEPQVGGGQPQDRRAPQDQPQPQTPDRPRPASADADADPQPTGELIA